MRVTCFLILLLTISCSRTTLKPGEISSAYLALGKSGTQLINCEISIPEDRRIGYQFMLIAIPFGKTYLDNPAQFFAQSCYKVATLNNYQLTYSEAAPLVIKITVERPSLNVYDLLVTRLVKAKIHYQIDLHEHGRLTKSRTNVAGVTRLKTLPFASEQQQIFSELLRQFEEDLRGVLRSGLR